jgi:hypothetical protein
VALIIVATVYENNLIQKGYDFNEEKKKKAEKDIERHEMNHINNNNNNNENECEMYSKIHQESDSQKLGELFEQRIFFSIKIIVKNFSSKVVENFFKAV